MNRVDRILSRDTVLIALSEHIGAPRGVSAAELVREITGSTLPDVAAERYLREIIVSLRLDGFHVCAHPARGYFMAADIDELNQTCRFLFDRSMTSLKQVAAMKRVALPDLEGQLRLRV